MAIKILGVITEDINIGDVFTTENGILDALGFPKSGGNTRLSYLKEAKRYVNWKPTGKLYRGNPTSEVIITEKYEVPLSKIDGRSKRKSLKIKNKIVKTPQTPKVYKYINKETNEVDYIGIVWSKNRELYKRINEHIKYDKMDLEKYEVYYFNVETKADSEIWEGHLISYYGTQNRLNKHKSKWGLCTFLIGLEESIEWIKYEVKKNE